MTDLTLYSRKTIPRNFMAAVCAVSLTVAAHSGRAATLTSVPMQGGMIMPMVSYNSSDGMMHVVMPPTIPQLTPLLVSNPSDNFDPADPWFDKLDPSGQGASFSRSYGFMMDAMSDPLPSGTQTWIRKLDGPMELKFYSYSSSPPQAFNPIFGTDSVTNALYWNGVMFHPVVAAPPGTNNYNATFEVYLLDTTTGQEVPNSSSGPFGLDWADVSDGRPVLSITQAVQQVVVAWPAGTTTNWVLESTSTINAAGWTTVTNTPVVLNGQPCVILGSGSAPQFFRMSYLP